MRGFRLNEKEADLTHLDAPTWMLCGYNAFLFVMSFSLSVFVFWLFVWTDALTDVRLVAFR